MSHVVKNVRQQYRCCDGTRVQVGMSSRNCASLFKTTPFVVNYKFFSNGDAVDGCRNLVNPDRSPNAIVIRAREPKHLEDERKAWKDCIQLHRIFRLQKMIRENRVQAELPLPRLIFEYNELYVMLKETRRWKHHLTTLKVIFHVLQEQLKFSILVSIAESHKIDPIIYEIHGIHHLDILPGRRLNNMPALFHWGKRNHHIRGIRNPRRRNNAQGNQAIQGVQGEGVEEIIFVDE